MDGFLVFFFLIWLIAALIGKSNKSSGASSKPADHARANRDQKRSSWQTEDQAMDSFMVLDMAEDGFFMPDGEKAFDDRYYNHDEPQEDEEQPQYEDPYPDDDSM